MTAWFEARAGIRLAYERAGDGDPALVFVHGWCCDRSYFAPQVEFFAARNATLSLDLCGHGSSDRPAPDPGVYSIEAFAADVLVLSRAAGFVRPIIVGHSLGGLVALACARSESVRAVVLVNPALLLDEASKRFAEEARPLIEGDTDGSWRKAFAERIIRPTDTAYRTQILRTAAETPAPFAAAAWDAIARYDGEAALAQIRVPALAVVSGANAARHLLAYPAVTLGVTVGAGHFNQLEVPVQVNATIARFVAETG
jgi:pimeloyl-ACP methyl ester carboxylesterase